MGQLIYCEGSNYNRWFIPYPTTHLTFPANMIGPNIVQTDVKTVVVVAALCFLDALLTDWSVVLWMQDTALGKPREVYNITTESSQCEDRLCASLSLTSATWVALSDGAGRLYLLRTGKRGDSSHVKWEVSISYSWISCSVIGQLCEDKRAVTNSWKCSNTDCWVAIRNWFHCR